MDWITLLPLSALPAAVAGGWFVANYRNQTKAAVIKRDERHIGGQFRVLRDFEIPVLGCYWAGHEYAMTQINVAAVRDAVEAGKAVITVEPR
jgi:hypothetical protein